MMKEKTSSALENGNSHPNTHVGPRASSAGLCITPCYFIAHLEALVQRKDEKPPAVKVGSEGTAVWLNGLLLCSAITCTCNIM